MPLSERGLFSASCFSFPNQPITSSPPKWMAELENDDIDMLKGEYGRWGGCGCQSRWEFLPYKKEGLKGLLLNPSGGVGMGSGPSVLFSVYFRVFVVDA